MSARLPFHLQVPNDTSTFTRASDSQRLTSQFASVNKAGRHSYLKANEAYNPQRPGPIDTAWSDNATKPRRLRGLAKYVHGAAGSLLWGLRSTSSVLLWFTAPSLASSCPTPR